MDDETLDSFFIQSDPEFDEDYNSFIPFDDIGNDGEFDSIFNFDDIDNTEPKNNISKVSLPNDPPPPPSLPPPPLPTLPTLNNTISQTSFSSSYGEILMMCDEMVSFKQMKEYLQTKISGRKDLRFNKEKLICLFDILAKQFGWTKLTRDETRKKDLIFNRLFKNKFTVVSFIQSYPAVIAQVLIEGK